MNNVTPSLGNATKGDGILLVDVGGVASAGAFSLLGPIVSGGFVYGLDFGGQSDTDNNFYLVTEVLSPDGAAYQAAPYLIGTSFADINGLLDRHAGRIPLGSDPRPPADAIDPLYSLTGAWGQVEGAIDRVEASSGYGIDRYLTNRWSIKAGYDADADISWSGRLILGGYLHYSSAESSVDSLYGSKSISSEAVGVGISATYYADGGSYIDLQGLGMGVDSDFAEHADLISTAAAASVEIGHVAVIGHGVSLIPGFQLWYNSTNASSFTDDIGIDVNEFADRGLNGRIGLALQAPLEIKQEAGSLLTASIDYVRDFSPKIGVKLNRSTVSAEVPSDWLEGRFSVDWTLNANTLLKFRAGYGVAIGEDVTYNSRVNASTELRIGF
jgi:outer membrane autotransporter protein